MSEEDSDVQVTGSGSVADASRTHRYELGPDEPPSEGVIVAVSAVTGRPPAALDPLYDVLDPDALDGLFAAAGPSSAERTGRMTFEYEGHTVAVDAAGTVTVCE